MIEDFLQLPPVSTTPVANLELGISPQIFEKFRNGHNGILRGLGETDSWKNQKSKISWHCPFNILQLLRLHSCFTVYLAVPGLPGICAFADRRLLITQWCRVSCHLYICRRFESYWRWYQGFLASVYLQMVTNYPKMQGSLSPLYLQAVCQLPVGGGIPGICLFPVGFPIPYDAKLPVTSIFAGDLPTTRWCRGSMAPAEGCQLPDDAGLPVTSIFAGGLKFLNEKSYRKETSTFAGGLPTTQWFRAPCHQYTPSPGPSSQPSSLWHSGYLSSTGLSYTNMW